MVQKELALVTGANGHLGNNLVRLETPDIVYHLRRIELSTLKTNAKA